MNHAGPENYPPIAPVSGNPFDSPRMKNPERIATGQLIINGQEVHLAPNVQPVYVVALPIHQIAAGVMRGVVFGGLVLGVIAFFISLVIMGLSAH